MENVGNAETLKLGDYLWSRNHAVVGEITRLFKPNEYKTPQGSEVNKWVVGVDNHALIFDPDSFYLLTEVEYRFYAQCRELFKTTFPMLAQAGVAMGLGAQAGINLYVCSLEEAVRNAKR